MKSRKGCLAPNAAMAVFLNVFPLLREKEIIKMFAQHFLRLIAQQFLHHWTGVGVFSLTVRFPNPFHRIFRNVPKPLLALA